MTKRILFTEDLLKFLIGQKYTHIQLRGIDNKVGTTSFPGLENNNDYILIPWKAAIGLFEDNDLQMEKIDCTDVIDMLGVEFGINFWVDLPENIADAYFRTLKEGE